MNHAFAANKRRRVIVLGLDGTIGRREREVAAVVRRNSVAEVESHIMLSRWLGIVVGYRINAFGKCGDGKSLP
jgi:hypothetical protein